MGGGEGREGGGRGLAISSQPAKWARWRPGGGCPRRL